MIEIVFEAAQSRNPRLSIILIDWSVRESFHILHYLNDQEADRQSFEIIWIEFYRRKPGQIQRKIDQALKENKHPPLDRWVVMNMPEDICFHKHLMYNLGILLAKGELITFCDSDAIVSPKFVSSIIEKFNRDKNIVLHMDEIRSLDKKFYPFNFPRIEEILSSPCKNLIEGKPAGLISSRDPLHMRNYGACMTAWRKDLIAIGGADESVDFIGYICGPYDMTFRLVNMGRKEVWHPSEWLIHTWHPGQEAGNFSAYCGVHDGLRISTTALQALRTGRMLPLLENQALRLLRLNGEDSNRDRLLHLIISEKVLKKWREQTHLPSQLHLWRRVFNKVDLLRHMETRAHLDSHFRGPWFTKYVLRSLTTNLRLYPVILHLLIQQLLERLRIKALIESGGKARRRGLPVVVARDAFQKFPRILQFILQMLRYNTLLVSRCWGALNILTSLGQKEFGIYGSNELTRILCVLSSCRKIKTAAIFDELDRRRHHGFKTQPLQSLGHFSRYIIIASVADVENMKAELKAYGFPEDRIITLPGVDS